MQRIIKFRGKHEGKYNTYFVEGFGINKRPDGLIFIINKEDGMWYEVECNTIGQYTGLKDKNGKEIYEGDIVTNGDKNIKYIVEWVDTGLKARQLSNRSYIGLEYWKEQLEVIGNILDNPKLLE